MSICVSVPSEKFVTQTFEPTKMPIGWSPTPIGSPTAVAEARSTRWTVSSPVFATRASCGPSEMPWASAPTGIVAVGSSSGSDWRRWSWSLEASTTHTVPLPAAIWSGLRSDLDGVAGQLVRLGVDRLQRALAGVGDEDLAPVDGDPVRAVADADRVRDPRLVRGVVDLGRRRRRHLRRVVGRGLLVAVEHAGRTERGHGERGDEQERERDEQRDAAALRPPGGPGGLRLGGRRLG